jgi:FlaA1/EpsC-like NDP-sugar epimerase
MGATKLLAEKYIQGLSTISQTTYITVRFGNVLNSLGSVAPTFRRQIRAGGPITVTHPEMVRFFMTIPEAVQLVLQAGAAGASGQVLILDMGEPVRIVDLARDMILLSGLRCPEDIEIVFTGVRPGEKLAEELFYPQETGARRIHEKIFCSQEEQPAPLLQVIADIQRLQQAAAEGSVRLRSELRAVVSHYADQSWLGADAARAA